MTKNEITALFEVLRSIDRKLESLVAAQIPPGSAESLELYVIEGRREVRVNKMEILKPGVKKLLKVVFKDAAGRIAKVDGAPVWVTDQEAMVALTPAEDGMSCVAEFKADAPAGLGKIQVKADADMGAGVKELVGTYEFEITSSEAVFVEMTAEDIVEEVPAPVEA